MKTAQFIERTHCINCFGTDITELSSGEFNAGTVGRFINEDPWGEHPAPFLVDGKWSFVKCNDCNSMFHRNILSPEWNERRFSKWMSQAAIEQFALINNLNNPASKIRRAAAHTAHVLQIEKLTRRMRGDNPVRILDFGCGYGNFLSMCSLYGFDAHGVDRSEAKRSNSVFKIHSEIDEIQGQFHAVTLFEVLEHLDNPKDILLQLKKLLLPDGILVLEVPNCDGVTDIKTRADYAKIHPLEHINAFTPETLKLFAEQAGFKQINKPFVCVSNSPLSIAKSLIKSWINPFVTQTTQLYFKKI